LSSCFSICARSNPLGSNIERGFKEVFIWFFGVTSGTYVFGVFFSKKNRIFVKPKGKPMYEIGYKKFRHIVFPARTRIVLCGDLLFYETN